MYTVTEKNDKYTITVGKFSIQCLIQQTYNISKNTVMKSTINSLNLMDTYKPHNQQTENSQSFQKYMDHLQRLTLHWS